MKPTLGILTAAVLLTLLGGCGDTTATTDNNKEHAHQKGEHHEQDKHKDSHDGEDHDDHGASHQEGDRHADQ